MLQKSKIQFGLLIISVAMTIGSFTAQAGSALPDYLVEKYKSMSKQDRAKAENMMSKLSKGEERKGIAMPKRTITNIKTGKKQPAIIEFYNGKAVRVNIANKRIVKVTDLGARKFKIGKATYRYTRGRVRSRYTRSRGRTSLSLKARRCMRNKRCRAVVGRFIRKHAKKRRYIPTRLKAKRRAAKRRKYRARR